MMTFRRGQMTKLIRPWRALTCMFIMFSMMNMQVSAQSIESAQNDLNATAEWIQEAQPVIQGIYGLMTTVDEAVQVMNRFNQGKLDQDQALGMIAQIEIDINTRSQSLRVDIMDLPPVPVVTTINYQSSLSAETLQEIIDQLETVLLSSLTMVGDAVRGDIDSFEAGFLASYEQTRVLVDLSNRVVDADLVAIPDPTHPQVMVLKCLMNSNNLTLAVLEFQAAFYELETEWTELDVLKKMEAIRRENRGYIDTGRQRTIEIVEGLRAARNHASFSDRAFLSRVIPAMETYSEHWRQEESLLASLDLLLETASTLEAPDFEIEIQLENTLNKIIEVEALRTALIQRRIMMMQQ